MRVNVIDAPMGKGKTTAMMNWCEEHTEEKVIFVTPFLSEVERIMKSIPYCAPDPEKDDSRTKLESAKRFILEGKSFITTHALFLLFTPDMADEIRRQEYILMIDEAPITIQELYCNKTDKQILIEHFCDVDNDGRLYWKESGSYDGVFKDMKEKIERGEVYLTYNNSLIWMYSYAIWSAFKEIFIATYKMSCQMISCYIQFHDTAQRKYPRAKYRPLFIDENYHLVEERRNYDISMYKSLITIDETSKINRLYKEETAYSVGWYQKNFDEAVFRNTLFNFFQTKKIKASDMIWTTYGEYYWKIVNDKGKGKWFHHNFLACNARAMNDYGDRHGVVYLVNRYPSPSLLIFFNDHGVYFDKDGFALSEMIQFIWRSAIRNGEPITLLVPSVRMRKLLRGWLDSGSNL